ncbi:hypothetical protein [Pseudobacteriovorax antillogorgiicola]|uniref:Phosphate-selective porin O and P n=1 Tax=Pseudobacteriovorax antillogorgiicola TaxID=1513793 RepID=A0A1Y6C8F6_9BACT|nr:hypothetical protein [Pseudobacteriovorax antillogorgiicola]TCS49777.1 hypothetical protein EDD56_11422 [Pseudobacteriovorax antillogorgiicola]SMF42793.1 hypothetical protein SAMN06296036_11321 [Pseudobacteriovorax antillogorgiicola]
MESICKFLIVSIALSFQYLPHLKAAEIDVEADLRLGADYRHIKKSGQLFFDTELKFKSERIHGVRAVIEAQAESDEREFEATETYLNYKVSETDRIYLGYRKSRLGIESYTPSKDRFFSKRSILSDKIEELAYVSLQPQIAWRKEQNGQRLRLAIGLPSSLDYNLQLGLVQQWGSWALGAWSIIQRDRQNYEEEAINGAMSINLNYTSEAHKLELELIAGIDPLATELRSVSSDGEVVFGGARLEYQRLIKGTAWAWSSRLAGLANDRFNSADRTYSMGAGLSWTQSKMLSYYLTGDLIGSVNPLDRDDISYLNSRAILEARVRF